MSQTIEIPTEFLKEVAEFQFPPSMQSRIGELMDKNTEDQLSEAERRELKALVEFSESVSIVRGRARLLLRQSR